MPVIGWWRRDLENVLEARVLVIGTAYDQQKKPLRFDEAVLASSVNIFKTPFQAFEFVQTTTMARNALPMPSVQGQTNCMLWSFCPAT